jgi:hypothetical protein
MIQFDNEPFYKQLSSISFLALRVFIFYCITHVSLYPVNNIVLGNMTIMTSRIHCIHEQMQR